MVLEVEDKVVVESALEEFVTVGVDFVVGATS
jgi:hypothetical protein